MRMGRTFGDKRAVIGEPDLAESKEPFHGKPDTCQSAVFFKRSKKGDEHGK
jgi:hypothetical protein